MRLQQKVWSTASVLVLLGVSACGTSDDEPADDAEVAPETSEADTEDAEDEPDTEETDDTDATTSAPEEGDESGSETVQGSSTVGPEEAIASIEYEIDDEDSLTISVATLEEVDGILLLEVYYRPNLSAGESVRIYDLLEESGIRTTNRSIGSTPIIYDRNNLKIYTAFHQNYALSADGSPSAEDGESIYWWGYFPELEDDVDSVDIEFSRDLPHLADVEVQTANGTGGD